MPVDSTRDPGRHGGGGSPRRRRSPILRSTLALASASLTRACISKLSARTKEIASSTEPFGEIRPSFRRPPQYRRRAHQAGQSSTRMPRASRERGCEVLDLARRQRRARAGSRGRGRTRASSPRRSRCSARSPRVSTSSARQSANATRETVACGRSSVPMVQSATEVRDPRRREREVVDPHAAQLDLVEVGVGEVERADAAADDPDPPQSRRSRGERRRAQLAHIDVDQRRAGEVEPVDGCLDHRAFRDRGVRGIRHRHPARVHRSWNDSAPRVGRGPSSRRGGRSGADTRGGEREGRAGHPSTLRGQTQRRRRLRLGASSGSARPPRRRPRRDERDQRHRSASTTPGCHQAKPVPSPIARVTAGTKPLIVAAIAYEIDSAE